MTKADKDAEAEATADLVGADDDEERRELSELYARQRAESAGKSGAPEARDKWLKVATRVRKGADHK